MIQQRTRWPSFGGPAGTDPDALERAADAAQERGAFDEAIRLRFQAGLLTLGDRGRLDYRPSLLTGDARRALHSDTFDRLAATFERVAYAHAPAERRRGRGGARGLANGAAEARARP